uniref:Reverse transcriptase domain-containing protein n=1 Tax=Tanacetum cinerariifolium TaxID=118510 RepID=A0A6L2NEJ9_TANCI|nr:reverse transcriptase domain-containing protein [Tanacetum cinerariifolium]
MSPAPLSPDYLNESKPIKDDPQEVKGESSSEEEELPALASFTLAIADPATPSKETEPFEEDKVAPTPTITHFSPYHLFIPERLRWAWKSVRPQNLYDHLLMHTLRRGLLHLYLHYHHHPHYHPYHHLYPRYHHHQHHHNPPPKILFPRQTCRFRREFDLLLCLMGSRSESALQLLQRDNQECQVKYATCTLLGGTLTWWNSHVRTIGYDVAYGMPWKTMMKMMTEAYCPRSEIKKRETELWNLTVKGTNVERYTQRFQELVLLCSIMVPDEYDKVERYVGGLLDSIQGSVMESKPKMLQEAIELARSLMDQKVRAYASRQDEN